MSVRGMIQNTSMMGTSPFGPDVSFKSFTAAARDCSVDRSGVSALTLL